ncbi:hypothetical protein DMP17_44650 [Pseudonocardia sp. TMWB2A]|uniref:nucleoside-diphosphate kinase n=1 Tax=Pseudonocardia sp. TMWB2A TaxID=687430 RepID=UPI00307F2A40
MNESALISGGRAPVPASLTRSPSKIRTFSLDPYYRDAVDDVVHAFGSIESAVPVLHELSPLVLRPDIIATRGGGRLLARLDEMGYVPVAGRPLEFTRHLVREIWRYQLNIATRQRIDVMDMVMLGAIGLYVLLRRRPPGTDVPATVMVSRLKGPSAPERRRPEHLRALAGPGQESVLTYIHVSDEPADIVRELGVFFDRRERLRLLAAARAGANDPTDVFAQLAQLEDDTTSATFDVSEALDELVRLVEARGRSAVGDETLALAQAVRTGRSRDWPALLGLVDRLGVPWPRWHRVAVAAHASDRHLDARPAVEDLDDGAWLPTGEPVEADRGVRS